MSALYLVGLLISVIILYFLLKLNQLVWHKNLVIQNRAGVEVLLNKRHDLFNNLISLIKNYSGIEPRIEKEISRMGVEARHAFTVLDQEVAELNLLSAVSRLIITSKNNSDIQSTVAFNNLVKDIAEIGVAIRNDVHYYNGSAREFNDRLTGFPSDLIARIFQIKAIKFFNPASLVIVENEEVGV